MKKSNSFRGFHAFNTHQDFDVGPFGASWRLPNPMSEKVLPLEKSSGQMPGGGGGRNKQIQHIIDFLNQIKLILAVSKEYD